MPTSTPPAIPPAILTRVALHVRALHTWNAAVTGARRMEELAGQPGRYEYDLLHATDAGRRLHLQTEAASYALAFIEQEATAHNVTPEALYAACGGKPALLEEGPHVREWGRSTHQQEERTA